MKPSHEASEQQQSIVYVVDDDNSVRDSLEDLFASVGLTAKLFASTHEFLHCERADVPGCLVLDVRMPGGNGLDFQNELLQAGVHVPIIFITAHGDIPMSVRAMKAGAIEFLTKPFREQDLLDAIEQGVARDRERRVAASVEAELRKRYASLSIGEQEVMGWIVKGLMNKQIAGALNVSEITVKVRRGQVMRKMGAGSLPELVRFAERLRGNTAVAVELRY